MKCTVCGNDNPDEATFCAKCGEKVKTPITIKAQRGPAMGGQYQQPAVRQQRAVRAVSTPGMCFYHQQLPAMYVCSRCGRSICRTCAKNIGGLAFCPHCYPY